MTLPSSPGYAPAVSRTHRIFPDPQSGYRVNGKFSICLPLGSDTTNGVSNPSLETNTTGYSATGGATIARTTAKQRRGAWALAVTPGAGGFDGAFFGTVATVGSTVYTFSCDFLGAAGVDYRIYVASTAGGAISGYYQFKATGRWQRVSITYQENTAPGVATNRRPYVTKAGGASTAVFYWDGLNFTATAFPVTYFDGDNRGFVPGRQDFYWTGTPHGSTSVMSGQTRAGGKLVPLAYFGFTLLAVLGLGMTPLNNIAIPLASGGGAFFQTTVEQDRVFDLVGALTGRSLPEVQRRRHDLIQAIKPDNVPFDQPLLMRYTPTDDCGNENGHDLDIVCSYESGMEGLLNNHYQENLDLRFHIWLPFVAREDGWAGTTLGYQRSLAINSIQQRTRSGTWQALSTGISSGIVSTVLYAIGNLYAGGSFTLASGIANTVRIARWDGVTWNALGSGALNNFVLAIAADAAGNIYAGGSFTQMGGVANTALIAMWTGSAWVAMGSGGGAGTVVDAIVVGPDGTVYASGLFPNMGGKANTANIAAWTAAGWASITPSGVANGEIESLAIGPSGLLYAGGAFTSINGVAANRVAQYNPATATWSALGVGANVDVRALTLTPDGTLYAGGSFTSIGGITTNYVAKWNGTVWAALGAGIGTFASGAVYRMVYNAYDGLLYIAGAFTAAGGLTVPQCLTAWNGSAFVYLDSIEPGAVASSISAMDVDGNGALTIGYGSAGSANDAVVTSTLNAGVVKTYPRLTLTGPGTVYQLKNYSTGRAVYFNLTLNAGEIAVLDFSDPQNVMFASNFRSNLLSTILAGSNLDWFLMPGANNVSLFIAGTVNVNTAAVLAWRNTYHAIDSALNLSVVN